MKDYNLTAKGIEELTTEELFAELDFFKSMHTERETRRNDLQDIGALITWIKNNKTSSIRLISDKDKKFKITCKRIIQDSIDYYERNYTSYLLPRKPGKPAGLLKQILSSGYFIIQELKRRGIKDVDILDRISVNADSKRLRETRKAWLNWNKLTKAQAKDVRKMMMAADTPKIE